MEHLKTDAALLDRLKNAVTRELSDAEIEKQRASFVRGSTGSESSLACIHSGESSLRKNPKAPSS